MIVVEAEHGFAVPCGLQRFEDPARAVEHAAECTSCKTAQAERRAAEEGPVPGTAGVRETAGERITRNTDEYRREITNTNADADSRRVHRLLVIIGAAEHALWFETRGQLGDEHATSIGVHERLLREASTRD